MAKERVRIVTGYTRMSSRYAGNDCSDRGCTVQDTQLKGLAQRRVIPRLSLSGHCAAGQWQHSGTGVDQQEICAKECARNEHSQIDKQAGLMLIVHD
jgi:hypothetical protein